MRRYNYKKYLILGAALFILVSFPAFFVESLRGGVLRLCSGVFRGAHVLSNAKKPLVEKLEGENHLLRIEIGKLRALLEQREKTAAMRQDLQRPYFSPKRCDEIQYLLGLCHQSVPAGVIYRDPGSWSSTLWVNVGEETNRLLNRAVIQKNSPVILGRSVVGAVDYVGKKQSRVRLITDVALTPSVRAARGFQHNLFFIESIDSLLRYVQAKNDTNFTAQEKAGVKAVLELLKERLSTDTEGWYLAKGVLQGAATPLYRSVNHTLRGVGFNYDFADDEGPARDLVTGKPIDSYEGLPAMPIIREGDLLVTTGMDGVFPPGLRAAEVTKIFPLREGAYTYELEAVPVVGNLDALQTVFIIPPVGFSIEEKS